MVKKKEKENNKKQKLYYIMLCNWEKTFMSVLGSGYLSFYQKTTTKTVNWDV